MWLVMLILVGCAKRPPASDALVLASVPDAPLTRRVTLTLDRPGTAAVEVDDGMAVWTVTSDAVARRHELTLLGLPSDSKVTLVPVLDGTRGQPMVVRIPPVPGAPFIEVLADSGPEDRSGWTLFNVEALGGGLPSGLAVLDEHLRLVHWLTVDPGFGDVQIGPDGDLVGLAGGNIVRMDLCGRELARIGPAIGAVVPVDLPESLHHEVIPLDDGSFVALSAESRDVPAFPTSYARPDVLAPATIRDALVVHIAPDGRLLRRVSMADLLDTRRIGFDARSDREGGVFDWAHANGIAIADDGTWLVSLRHQDAIVGVSQDDSLAFILSDPGGWVAPWTDVLIVPDDPAYHQHAPAMDGNGRLVLFDNHNDGATPYGETSRRPALSRALAWDLDLEAGTAIRAWQSYETATGPLYADAVGDADPLPGGTVLVTYGTLRNEEGLSPDDTPGPSWARIVEVDPATDAVHMDVRITLPGADRGVRVYRAERIAPLTERDAAAVCR